MEMQSIPQMFFARACEPRQRPAQLVKRGYVAGHLLAGHERQRAQHRQGLLALGLQMGDRVALLANSRAEWVQCDLGIMAAAGITVPVYPSAPLSKWPISCTMLR